MTLKKVCEIQEDLKKNKPWENTKSYSIKYKTMFGLLDTYLFALAIQNTKYLYNVRYYINMSSLTR